MANITVEELRTELKDACEKYETRYSGMEYLVNYYKCQYKSTTLCSFKFPHFLMV